MYAVLQVLTIVLVAIGMGLSLAHALEWPGKRRLDRDTYVAVQGIYYPGFTVGGLFGEFGAIVAAGALALATPFPTTDTWLTLGALAALLIMHALYWLLTHPVNKVWVTGQAMGGAGSAFFAAGSRAAEGDWRALRDRWELSHALRALFALASLIALAAAAVV